MQPKITWGLEQPIWFNEVIQCVSPPLSLSIFLSIFLCLLANYTVSCLASWPFFLLSLIFPPSFWRPGWALIEPWFAGDKTWSCGVERDIWEWDGERDSNHVPTWSPSPGSVEAFTARRWAPLSACVQCLAVQHLWNRCQIYVAV